MLPKSQTRFLKILSMLTITALLVTTLSMFATQRVFASGVVGTITHPGFLPQALALDESRNRLFVFDQATGSVFIYNAATRQELGSVATTLTAVTSMVVDESAGKLYVGYIGPGVDVTNGIAVINTATMALIKYIPSGGYTYLVKDETLNVVYASSNYYGLRKIDVSSDTPTTIAGINGNIYTSMAVNPVTHELFIANWSQNDDNFFIVDPTTLHVTTVPNMAGFGVALNWTENKAYVTYCVSAGYEGVCIYDRDTGTINRIHTNNDSSNPMVFNPSLNRVYSDSEVNAVASIFNGSTDTFTNVTLTGGLATVGVRYSTDNVYYVDAAGTYVMKGSTGEIVSEFPIGASCSLCNAAILINQTSGLVYVINDTAAGLVTVIQDGVFVLPPCAVTLLAGAGTIPGALTSSDCRSPIRYGQSYWDPYFADRYSLNGTAGQQLSILVDGGDAYEYIYLLDPSGNILAEASGDYFSGARLPDSGLFTLPVSGTYILEVTSVYSGLENGSFADSEWPYTMTLTLTTVPPAGFNKSSPANGATDQLTSLILSWEPSIGAGSYEYCYDTTNDNACSNWVSNGTSTSKALSGLSAGSTYYWQVRAVNAGGTTYSNGSSTAYWSFATKSSFTISGNVGVSGATLSYADVILNLPTSQTNGSYAFQVPNGWSGTVTPSHPCFTFSPTSRTYSNMSANQTLQNYIPTLKPASGCANIDISIGGTSRGRFGLSSQGSTRASFTSVNDGPVEINSTNNIPLIAAERVIYKVGGVNTSFTEMMALPDSQLDDTYWLPWYNNVDLDTQLRIGNVSGSTANVHIFIGGAEVTPISGLSLGAGASTRLNYPGVNNGPVKIQSDQNIVAAERLIYKVNGTPTSFAEMMALPNSQLNTIYWLPWYNNADLDTQLRIGNVSPNPATVHIFIGGAEVTPIAGISLGAGASTRLNYPGVNNGPVKIQSDQNIVAAERVVYKVSGAPTSFTEMMALPNSQLNATYWLPWYNNVDLDTQLRIGNVSGNPATVHIYIGGTEVSPVSGLSLANGASIRLSYPGVNNGPVKILSNQNIVVAERVIYKVNNVNTSFSEMMGLPDTQLNATYWLPWYNNVDLDTQLRFGTP